MLFQDSYVVVFYKTHPNTGYAYTPLATIDDADGLAQAVGADAVEAGISPCSSAAPNPYAEGERSHGSAHTT